MRPPPEIKPNFNSFESRPSCLGNAHEVMRPTRLVSMALGRALSRALQGMLFSSSIVAVVASFAGVVFVAVVV